MNLYFTWPVLYLKKRKYEIEEIISLCKLVLFNETVSFYCLLTVVKSNQFAMIEEN